MTDTATRRCVVCAKRPVDDGRMACLACEARMADQLHDVLEMYALAEGELVPGSGSGQRGTERSLGVRIAALDFLAGHDAVAILASWESEWREHYGLAVDPMIARPGPLLARTVAFLRGWLPRACEDHPAIDEFARELWDCWSEARAAARVAPARSLSITCVADDDSRDDGLCGRRIPVSPDEVRGQVQCRRCRTVWDVTHLMHVAIATPGAELWADPEAAAGYFGLSVTDLRRLATRQQLTLSHGRYDLRAIHATLEQSRQDGYRALAQRVVGTA